MQTSRGQGTPDKKGATWAKTGQRVVVACHRDDLSFGWELWEISGQAPKTFPGA